jgi:hypothetical protein
MTFEARHAASVTITFAGRGNSTLAAAAGSNVGLSTSSEWAPIDARHTARQPRPAVT